MNKISESLHGFSGSVCIYGNFNANNKTAALLEKIKTASSVMPDKKYVSVDSERKLNQGRYFKNTVKKGKSKILLFRNIFNSPDKEQNHWLSPGAHYLASGLRENGFRVIFSDSKISLNDNKFITGRAVLENILREHPDLNFIGISICEDFFEKARELIRFMRVRTKAFIGVGGVMPTLTPEHVFVHLPEVNFLVRGAGEEVFPELTRILNGNFINSVLNKRQIEELLKLNGFIFRNNKIFIVSRLNKINWPKDYDHSPLDFSFVEKENLSEGLNLFTSRGCYNNCFFCTTPGRGRYFAKSFQGLKRTLGDYKRRLEEIFKDSIPDYALKISFNDDDFLADAGRSVSFFAFLRTSPFKINFFQTGINSFFNKRKSGYSDSVNQKLIRNLPVSKFSANWNNIYIGTENFCDEELKRLNKGYNFFKIKKVIKALSEKKIYQVHHFIASNHLTTPENILENLVKIAIFQLLYGQYFKILTPINPYVVSLYPSSSYRIALSNKREKFLNLKGRLTVKNYPQYDYPLVTNDIPINRITRAIMPDICKLFLNDKDYLNILDSTLLEFLLLGEKSPAQKKEIKSLIEKFKDYPQLIIKKGGYGVKNDRNNLQLMITRRCQLRCKYCPIKKNNLDLKEKFLYPAIDFLFTSSRKSLRLDFTGGEPLLRFDLIKKGVEYAKKIAKKKNRTISFYLVTNLIALNDEIADFLAQENFFLELSVDGSEKYHNFYKISKDRKINPYKTTTAQLKRIFSRKVNNYAVLVTAPATVSHLFQNFEHLLQLGFRQIGINYALGSIWQQGQRKIFFRQLDLILERFGLYIKNGVIQLSNLGSRVEPAVLNSEIMVDIDGSVHLLTDWLFEKSYPDKIAWLGHIEDLKDLNDIFISKFSVLYRLLKQHNSPVIRRAIINNIEMGNLTRQYFAGWKENLRI